MPVIDLPPGDDSDLDPLATLDELKARYDVTDDDQAEIALSDISALIREATGYPNIWSDTTKVPQSVKVICLRATMRYLDNPSGYSNESYGSYSYGYSKDFSVGLWLTDAEIARIQQAAGAGNRMKTIQFVSNYSGPYHSGTIYSQPYNDTDPMPVWDGNEPF